MAQRPSSTWIKEKPIGFSSQKNSCNSFVPLEARYKGCRTKCYELIENTQQGVDTGYPIEVFI